MVILQLRYGHSHVYTVSQDFVHIVGNRVLQQDIEHSAHHIVCFFRCIFGYCPPENVVIIVKTVLVVRGIAHQYGGE